MTTSDTVRSYIMLKYLPSRSQSVSLNRLKPPELSPFYHGPGYFSLLDGSEAVVPLIVLIDVEGFVNYGPVLLQEMDGTIFDYTGSGCDRGCHGRDWYVEFALCHSLLYVIRRQ